MSETVQFSGEDAWDAFVNHNSLDIVEEDEFMVWCEARNVEYTLPALEAAYREFQEAQDK